MTTQERSQCMFVGIDVHKDTHTAVGISPYGEKLFEITVGNYKQDFESLVKKVSNEKRNLSPYIGLEDVRGYGERLAGYLYEKYPIYHVPSILVDKARQNATHPEKNVLSFLEEIGRAQIRKVRNIFLWCRGARRWRGGSVFPLKKGSRKVYDYSIRKDFEKYLKSVSGYIKRLIKD